MIENKYLLAIVGFGGMGNWHGELIQKRFTDIVLAGIYDIKQERIEFAKNKNIYTYKSLNDILNDENVDIVVIATPNDVHKDIAIKSLKADKHVVCEKPVTINSSELQEIFNAAREYNKIFTVHQNRRWDEDFRTIKKIYDEGLIGDVYKIESRVHGSRGIPGDWRRKKAHGGGMMLDWGVHLIDQILLMVNEKVKRIYCKLTHITNDEVDDGFNLIMTFESGITVLLEVGTNNFINLPRWYMMGEKGTAVINDWSMNGKIVRARSKNENDAIPVKTAAGLTKTMAPRTEKTIITMDLPKVQTDISDYYLNLIDAIKGKTEIIVKHEEVMRVMKVMEAAFESDRLDKVVNFE